MTATVALGGVRFFTSARNAAKSGSNQKPADSPCGRASPPRERISRCQRSAVAEGSNELASESASTSNDRTAIAVRRRKALGLAARFTRHPVAQDANAFDLDFDDVARRERTDPGGRAGQDDVAR